MKKSFLLAALLSLCLVSCGDKQSSSNSVNNNDSLNNSSQSSNSQNNSQNSGNNGNDIIVDDITTTDYNGYYKNVLNLEGEELIKGLHDLINEGRFTSYGELKTAYYDTDIVKGDNTHFVDFYTHNPLPVAIDWNNNWNREHVWPKSLGVEGTNAYSDLHHIRPCNPKLNSFRGNTLFGNVTSGTTHSGCKKSGNVFEPIDISKGDSARIVVYVAVAHNINIRKVMSGSDEVIKETLLSWNALDPVDEIETNRNDKAQEIQHNRNVFIDSSDLFEKVVNTIL